MRYSAFKISLDNDKSLETSSCEISWDFLLGSEDEKPQTAGETLILPARVKLAEGIQGSAGMEKRFCHKDTEMAPHLKFSRCVISVETCSDGVGARSAQNVTSVSVETSRSQFL